VAFALQADGWWLRSDIIWAKPNPMPESVTDRPTKAHEYLFLLTKSQTYYYDAEAIKEPIKEASIARLIQDVENQEGSERVPGKTNGKMKAVKFGGNNPCPDTRLQSGKEWNPSMAGGGTSYKNGHSGYFDKDGKPLCGVMANKKSVWTIPTMPFKEAHFATFPPKLIEPCVLAGSKAGDLVMDCFYGAGTTALVAKQYNRHCLGIELNKDYIDLSLKRLTQEVLAL
jgi:DNA modification methylase